MSSKAAAASTAPLVPTESPVPGINITLASLLVEAIKTRRKFISKSSSLQKDDEKESLMKNIENKAVDATTAFLNELRSQAESSSASWRSKNSASAPPNCQKFLLEIISNDSNSFHLRRSALALIGEILQRSSDARAYLAIGETLLDFVSVVEGSTNSEESDAALSNTSSSRGANETILSPAALFQQEATELIYQLASQYGQLYPKFTVASRLLGDMSAHLQMNSQQIGTIVSGEGRRSNNQRNNIHLFRRKRDEALERGPKACQSLERMIDRADYCFKVLLPRWGGFNIEINEDNKNNSNELAASDNPISDDASVDLEDDDSRMIDRADYCFKVLLPRWGGFNIEINEDNKNNSNELAASDNPISDDASVDLEDDDSIEWEEGDDGLLSDDEAKEEDRASGNDLDNSSHVGAVAQTLAVMERSGTLLDGKLSVEVTNRTRNSFAQTELKSETREDTTKADARHELEETVKKLSSKRVQRLNQWIHALTYADGMMARSVADPVSSAASGNVGTVGPVSVVLLPKDKRTSRGPLLQHMMKLKGEIESVLRSADALGVHSGNGEAREDDDVVQAIATPAPRNVGVAKRKRPWLSGTFTQGHQTTKKQKQTKNAKVRVIYRKK